MPCYAIIYSDIGPMCVIAATCVLCFGFIATPQLQLVFGAAGLLLIRYAVAECNTRAAFPPLSGRFRMRPYLGKAVAMVVPSLYLSTLNG